MLEILSEILMREILHGSLFDTSRTVFSVIQLQFKYNKLR